MNSFIFYVGNVRLPKSMFIYPIYLSNHGPFDPYNNKRSYTFFNGSKTYYYSIGSPISDSVDSNYKCHDDKDIIFIHVMNTYLTSINFGINEYKVIELINKKLIK